MYFLTVVSAFPSSFLTDIFVSFLMWFEEANLNQSARPVRRSEMDKFQFRLLHFCILIGKLKQTPSVGCQKTVKKSTKNRKLCQVATV